MLNVNTLLKKKADPGTPDRPHINHETEAYSAAAVTPSPIGQETPVPCKPQ